MSDILRVTKVDHDFGDVLGVIGDSLNAFRDHHEIEAAGNILGVLDHVA